MTGELPRSLTTTMTVQLDDYDELLTELGDHPAEVLRASWQEAVARLLAARARGLPARRARAQVPGARHRPRRLASSRAPGIAREIGEDAVDDLLRAALAMASKTSGAVIALVCATAPLAARRLGDIELFRGYLRLLEQLARAGAARRAPDARSPRHAARPLTLGGPAALGDCGARRRTHRLRRAGALLRPGESGRARHPAEGAPGHALRRRAAAHRRCTCARCGGAISSCGPRAATSSRARATGPSSRTSSSTCPTPSTRSAGVSGPRPLPRHGRRTPRPTSRTRARPLSAEALTPLQMAVIGVIEDARIETLAIREFPGLRELWRRLHRASPDDGGHRRAARRASPGRCSTRLTSIRIRSSRRLAKRSRSEGASPRRQPRVLGRGCRASRTNWSSAGARFNPRSDVPAIAYRDDNRYVWEFDGIEYGAGSAALYRGAAGAPNT